MFFGLLTFIGHADAYVRISEGGNLFRYRIAFYERTFFGKIRLRSFRALGDTKIIGTYSTSAEIEDLKLDAKLWKAGGSLPQSFIRKAGPQGKAPVLKIIK